MNHDLDVYAIQNNKDETKVALEKVIKDAPGNLLYLNCTCYFKIGDEEVTSRTFDACFYSEESDVLILFAKGKITYNEIEEYLKEMDVNYNVIYFNKKKEFFKDENCIKEIWFAREKYVLKEAIEDSLSKNITSCSYFPNEITKLSIGYIASRDSQKYFEIDKRLCKGTVVFPDKVVFLISQGQKYNLTKNQTISILNNKMKVLVSQENKSNVIKRR